MQLAFESHNHILFLNTRVNSDSLEIPWEIEAVKALHTGLFCFTRSKHPLPITLDLYLQEISVG